MIDKNSLVIAWDHKATSNALANCFILDAEEVSDMWFWWFMLCCDLIIPVLMIVIGRLMWKRPPQRINSLIGYRTSRSMKNMDTWLFAHHYSGKLWWRTGWVIIDEPARGKAYK